MMDKYLPNHAAQDPKKKWVYGWHEEKTVEYNDWDEDRLKNAITSTEGYYPLKEEEEERKWGELTNANEHNASAALENAKKEWEAAQAAKLAAEGEEGAAEGEAKAEDAKGAEGGGDAAAAPKEEAKDAPKALSQKPVKLEYNDSDIGNESFSTAAKFNMLAQGHFNTDHNLADDVDSSAFDEDKEAE